MTGQKKREVPLNIIERWLKDEDCDVRTAAMNACVGREVPLDIIERWLKDEYWKVRTAAMNACTANGIPFPISRTFEPPERVYKKCIGDVIVVASIPKDAHVRGKAGQKCRASKAVVLDVIGNVCEEPVGISIYDKKTLYYAGDEVVITNFDFSHDECSSGFHFFCTLQEAEQFNG